MKTEGAGADTAGTEQAIVIATHISGTRFLENLLHSFRGYARYPILVVINEYVPEQESVFAPIIAAFPGLPITVLTLKQNAFEFGGLYAAYHQTRFEEFFLLSHSCEIVDTGIFDIVFDTHRGRSVACFPTQMGRAIHWNAHLGKYRRQVLKAMDFTRFMPRNIYEATYHSEFHFTRRYHRSDPLTVLLHPPGSRDVSFVEKYGRLRMRMAIPPLIKWKTHWNAQMLLDDFPAGDRLGYLRARASDALRRVRAGARKVRRSLRAAVKYVTSGWGWHPHYYRWLWARLRHPDLGGRRIRTMMRFLRYSPAAVGFFVSGGDEKLITHDLDENSLVLDVGGFVGEWTAAIVERYGARVMVFEPMPRYRLQLTRRFEGRSNVTIRSYGLSGETAVVRMRDDFMGSSVFARHPNVAVHMRDIAEVFDELGGQRVDLIKINIEGGEYVLLERMLEHNLLARCRKVIVQFHDRYHPRRDAVAMRASLVARIERTHAPVFQYPFVWEAWETRADGVVGPGSTT